MNDTLLTIIVCAILISIGLNIICFQTIGFLKKDMRSLEKEFWKIEIEKIKNKN